jgi:hypothetical protein
MRRWVRASCLRMMALADRDRLSGLSEYPYVRYLLLRMGQSYRIARSRRGGYLGTVFV